MTESGKGIRAMNDPHVVSLNYRVSNLPNVVYDNPSPVFWNNEVFIGNLKTDGSLLCEMKIHFSSIESAKQAVEELLHAWRVAVILQLGSDEIHFLYQDGHIIDRNPPPPGSSITIRPSFVAARAMVGTPTIVVSRNKFPDPPSEFRLTSNASILWHRYQNYKSNNEPLLSMTYFCLTILEADAGGRKAAAKKYQIELKILEKLGEYSSNRGDHATARKAKAVRDPLTDREIRWVESAIKLLIFRLGEYKPDKTLKLLKMELLPPI
jgi:hypothetical protein